MAKIAKRYITTQDAIVVDLGENRKVDGRYVLITDGNRDLVDDRTGAATEYGKNIVREVMDDMAEKTGATPVGDNGCEVGGEEGIYGDDVASSFAANQIIYSSEVSATIDDKAPVLDFLKEKGVLIEAGFENKNRQVDKEDEAVSIMLTYGVTERKVLADINNVADIAKNEAFEMSGPIPAEFRAPVETIVKLAAKHIVELVKEKYPWAAKYETVLWYFVRLSVVQNGLAKLEDAIFEEVKTSVEA